MRRLSIEFLMARCVEDGSSKNCHWGDGRIHAFDPTTLTSTGEFEAVGLLHSAAGYHKIRSTLSCRLVMVIFGWRPMAAWLVTMA
jgi:hypothetical protein